MAKPIYSGFSTVGRFKKFKVTDFELAKTDLINYLSIRKGEKIMNPDFGTIIWGLLFEPLTAELKSAVSKDLTTIMAYDPRLVNNGITITEYEHGLQVMIELTYLPTNQADTLRLNFDRNALK